MLPRHRQLYRGAAAADAASVEENIARTKRTDHFNQRRRPTGGR